MLIWILLQEIERLQRLNELLEFYGVPLARFKAWLRFRNIQHSFKQDVAITADELHITRPTIVEMAKYLIDQQIVDNRNPTKIAKDIGHALDRKQGRYCGITFHRVKQ